MTMHGRIHTIVCNVGAAWTPDTGQNIVINGGTLTSD
jgi:hypothetical protein